MENIEITEIEAQPDKRLLFNVRLNADPARVDFSVGITDLGSGAANEIAVLNAALDLGEQLAAAARRRLAAPPVA